MFDQFRLHQRVGLIIVTAIVSIVTIGLASLTSRVVSNAGLLALARSLAQDSTTSAANLKAPELINADSWLEAATRLDVTNRGAWRGLGFALEALGKDDKALAVWSIAGFTAQDYIRLGEQQRQKLQYSEALKWYLRAVQAESNSAIPWYYVGLAYESLQQWNKAATAFQHALDQRDGTTIAGSLNLEIGSILQEHIKPADLAAALSYYDAALRSDQFVNGWERVNAHYFRGAVLRQQKRLPEALPEFRWVVGAAPDHYWGHMWLGLLTWQVDGDAQQAEQFLKAAAALRPDIKWSYNWLADIYRQTGRLADAAEAYRQVLNIDPQDQAAHQFLSDYSKNVH